MLVHKRNIFTYATFAHQVSYCTIARNYCESNMLTIFHSLRQDWKCWVIIQRMDIFRIQVAATSDDWLSASHFDKSWQKRALSLRFISSKLSHPINSSLCGKRDSMPLEQTTPILNNRKRKLSLEKGSTIGSSLSSSIKRRKQENQQSH